MVNIRAVRLNKGLSAEVAARKIGITKQVLLNAENGQNVPRPESALKIAKFCECDVTDIWPVEEAAA